MVPDRTYLFITVMRIEDPQYASTGRIGLFETELGGALRGSGGASKALFP